jgi:DNA adenine methylase
MTIPTTLKPILKYPGAKWRIAPWIVSHFPTHEHYLEPYCGSAAVFFTKEKALHEVLNDTNGAIVNLFQVLRDPEQARRLAEWVNLTPWAEAEYNQFENDYESSSDPVENARRFLVRSWQAHGGTIHQVSGWRHNGLHGNTHPVRLWRKLPERLLAVVDRLKEAEIRNRPALEMIAYYNDPGCLIYADPPYVLSTRARKYYRQEMTDAEHRELLEALEKHTGPVLLSGYSHSLYEERLTHWQQVHIQAPTEHGNVRTEVLWLNPRAAHMKQLCLFPDPGREEQADVYSREKQS